MSVPLYETESEYEYEGEYEGEQMIRRVLAGARRLGGRISARGSRPAGARPTRPLSVRVGGRMIPTLVRLLVTDPLEDPALPPEPPPVVAQDERRQPAGGSPPDEEFEDEYEFELEGEYEGEGEFEGEGEYEFEGESESSRQALRPPSLMRFLAHAAAAAESEDEAEAFVGALVPLAAQAVPRASSAVMRVAPQLIRGLSDAARTMRRNPRTRPLIGALPAIAQRTAASLAHSAARGRPVTPQTAVRSLARQTAYVLGTPGVREQMMGGGGGGGGRRAPGRDEGPFNITLPAEDRSPAGNARRARTVRRQMPLRRRRVREILDEGRRRAGLPPEE